MTGHVEQPMPTPNDGPSIQSLVRDDITSLPAYPEPLRALVLDDITAREQVGVARYGVALQAHNGRDYLRDLYEEILDGTLYARQGIAETTEPGDALEQLQSVYGALLHELGRVRLLIDNRTTEEAP